MLYENVREFSRKLNYLMNESLTLGNRYLQGKKKMIKRDANICWVGLGYFLHVEESPKPNF